MERSKWFGSREFYESVIVIAVPIMVQNGITTFVNMLDNIMVGQVGTLPMSGVSITNQLLMIFNLAVFGANNAAGIFGAQFYGKGDKDGVNHCFHFKIMVSILVTVLGVLIFVLKGRDLVSLYMDTRTNTAEEIALTTGYAMTYMYIMLAGLPAFTMMTAVSSSVRETGETRLAMRASIIAVLINFAGNYILIFGHFGFPRLGIVGAALATVIARFVEFALILLGTLKNADRFYFIKDIRNILRVPGNLAKAIIRKGAPLVINEVMWSSALAVIAQCYSTRGLDAVAAVNINSTIQNVFMITNMAMGISISIMVGQRLGADKIEDAVDTDRRLIVFSVLLSLIMGTLLFVLSPVFPNMYNTGKDVRILAENMLKITALYLPIHALYIDGYFTLRSGGKTVITFLFDGVYTFAVNVTCAFLLSRLTDLPILVIFLAVQLCDLPKALFGVYLVHKRVWVQNLTGE